VLDSYDHIMAAGVNAGNAKKSLIYKVLTRGVEAMPPKQKLTGNQIALIYSWIEGGAENTTGCGCDTFNVKYSTTIAPVFTTYCISCHGADSTLNFSSYPALSVYLDTSAQKLLDDINYVSGSHPMPPGTKLDSCTIKKITNWIHSGYPNN
jgi:mono/diheme cytochrome c family protein